MHTSCRFVKSRVDLSASRYVNCVFDECVLLISGKPVHVEGCTFIRPKIEFVGEAGNTISLLGYFCANAPGIAESTAEILELHKKTKH